MGIRDWLAIIVIIFIVLILLDGFRRKWKERKTRIRVKLDKNIPPADGDDEADILVKSELPSGGARIKPRSGQEVPVLMDSVDIDSEDIAEYGEPEDDWDGDWEADDSAATAIAGRADEAEIGDEDDVDVSDALDGQVQAADTAFDDDDEPGADEDDDPWRGTEKFSALDEEDDEPAPAAPAPAVTARQEARKPAKNRRGGEDRIEPTFGNEELTFGRDDQGELNLEHHDLFEHENDAVDTEAEDREPAAEVIIINVMAKPGASLDGARLLPVLLKQGMRLGDMSIFHRHADNSGKGPVMFSMANMLKPGTFAMSEMETFATPGVSFFMQLPNKLGNMQCFEQMLKTAQAVKEALDAVLKDENRSVLTRQTIEHSRQRIRDFELEMLARK